VRIAPAASNADLVRRYAEATLVCVPLKRNGHASGITVIQEAVLAGVPVVASDTGGLTSYFSGSEVRYVPPGDVSALRDALLAVAKDPVAAREMAVRAQARLTGGSLGAEAYVRRHVQLSRELLGR
jgi:glycosyltransferase involved in cell wall biosynthesis